MGVELVSVTLSALMLAVGSLMLFVLSNFSDRISRTESQVTELRIKVAQNELNIGVHRQALGENGLITEGS